MNEFIRPIPLFSLCLVSFFLSSIIPRCLCESLEQTKSLLKVSDECWVLIVFLEKIISIACLEGSGLKYIFHWSAQSTK